MLGGGLLFVVIIIIISAWDLALEVIWWNFQFCFVPKIGRSNTEYIKLDFI